MAARQGDGAAGTSPDHGRWTGGRPWHRQRFEDHRGFRWLPRRRRSWSSPATWAAGRDRGPSSPGTAGRRRSSTTCWTRFRCGRAYSPMACPAMPDVYVFSGQVVFPVADPRRLAASEQAPLMVGTRPVGSVGPGGTWEVMTLNDNEGHYDPRFAPERRLDVQPAQPGATLARRQRGIDSSGGERGRAHSHVPWRRRGSPARPEVSSSAATRSKRRSMDRRARSCIG